MEAENRHSRPISVEFVGSLGVVLGGLFATVSGGLFTNNTHLEHNINLPIKIS